MASDHPSSWTLFHLSEHHWNYCILLKPYATLSLLWITNMTLQNRYTLQENVGRLFPHWFALLWNNTVQYLTDPNSLLFVLPPLSHHCLHTGPNLWQNKMRLNMDIPIICVLNRLLVVVCKFYPLLICENLLQFIARFIVIYKLLFIMHYTVSSVDDIVL